MGWFLSSKNSSGGSGGKKSKRKTGRGARAKGWDPERTLLGLKLAGGVAVAIALVIGWNAAERTLGRYAAEARSVTVTTASVKLVDAPSWMDASLRDQLCRKVAHSVNDNPLDGRGLRDAAAVLDDEPWIARVRQVRRVAGGVVKVTADYRTPAALVRDRQDAAKAHVVDHDGVWLDGPLDRASSRWGGLPLVTGVAAGPPTEGYGRAWPGADLRAALALETLLRREPYADQITAYDVSHRDLRNRLWLVLYTDGPAIVWGLPPGEEHAVEPQAPVKLAALRDWANTHAGRVNVTGVADTVWVYTGTAQIDARPDHLPTPATAPNSVSASRR
ncbi:MAG: hypothetical protein AAFX76_01845 [Planctomycetota bacterium]